MADRAEHVNQIFISYRREDSAAITGRIYDRLTQEFGREVVFKDVDSIPLGVNFRKHLDSIISECAVALVVIGDRWLVRLDDPRDFVRIEIESALRRNIPVIPLLVQNATLPPEQSLPESLRELSDRHGMTIGHDPHFHVDISRLITSLRTTLEVAPSRVGSTERFGPTDKDSEKVSAAPAVSSENAPVAPKRRTSTEPDMPSPRHTLQLSLQKKQPLYMRLLHSNGLTYALLVFTGGLNSLLAFAILLNGSISIINKLSPSAQLVEREALAVVIAELSLPYVLALLNFLLGQLDPPRGWKSGLWLAIVPFGFSAVTLVMLLMENPWPYRVSDLTTSIAVFFGTLLIPIHSCLGWHLGRLRSRRKLQAGHSLPGSGT